MRALILQEKHFMATRGVKINYDSVSDVLYVHFVLPYVEQWIDSLDEETTARLKPVSKTVEGLEIWHYMARLEAGEDVPVPISASDIRVLEAA
jgi:uncharacterized protein YuzE